MPVCTLLEVEYDSERQARRGEAGTLVMPRHPARFFFFLFNFPSKPQSATAVRPGSVSADVRGSGASVRAFLDACVYVRGWYGGAWLLIIRSGGEMFSWKYFFHPQTLSSLWSGRACLYLPNAGRAALISFPVVISQLILCFFCIGGGKQRLIHAGV